MSSVDPFLVMVLGVLSGVVFVAFIHCVAASCIRNNSGTLSEPARPPNMHQVRHGPTIRVTISEASSSSSSSVDLPVHKYSKEFKEGMCAVCLGEFEENDEVRIMPECAHVFHVSCIDMWLFSHDNCPLCRASATPRARNVLFSIVTSSTVEQPGLNVV